MAFQLQYTSPPTIDQYKKKTSQGITYTDTAAYNKALAKYKEDQTKSYISSINQMESTREAKTTAQESSVMKLYDQIIGLYGSNYGAGELAMLERQKTKDIASSQQSLVSSGLYGTTLTAGLGKKWEEEIGVPSRLKLEDVRKTALASAYGAKAQAIQGIEYEPIDYNTIASLMQSIYGGTQ